MNKSPIHGLTGTLTSLFLLAMGKGLYKLPFVSLVLIGIPLHQWLSDLSLLGAFVAVILTAINNSERAYNNIARWAKYLILKIKNQRNRR